MKNCCKQIVSFCLAVILLFGIATTGSTVAAAKIQPEQKTDLPDWTSAAIDTIYNYYGLNSDFHYNDGFFFYLADMDFDGVPEIYEGALGGTGRSYIDSFSCWDGAKYISGKIIAESLNNFEPALLLDSQYGFLPYRNNTTGEIELWNNTLRDDLERYDFKAWYYDRTSRVALDHGQIFTVELVDHTAYTSIWGNSSCSAEQRQLAFNALCKQRNAFNAEHKPISYVSSYADFRSFPGFNEGESLKSYHSIVSKPDAEALVKEYLGKVGNIYNLREETYSFTNFSDSKSDGYCFGMSVTSSGYYLGWLDKAIIGINDSMSLFGCLDSPTVRKPIRYYHHIQGPSAERDSIVAGGSIDLGKMQNIYSDWVECVNYVKSHEYDHKGKLQVGMWFDGGGGHAVNFLYYKKTNGQDRIYVYDNNIPQIETYYYMGSDGYVHQAPEKTTSRGIVCIDLMDVQKYFALAPEFELNRYVYADKNEIAVNAAKMYNMKCDPQNGTYVMYEIPAGIKQVTITPLVANAEFEYMDDTFGFGGINSNTYGVLTLSDSEDDADIEQSNMTIYNGNPNQSVAALTGFVEKRTVSYRTTISFTATIENPVGGGQVRWFINGMPADGEDNCTVTQARNTFTVQAKYLQNKAVIAESPIETVRVRNDFFSQIVAMIRAWFHRLPVIIQK